MDFDPDNLIDDVAVVLVAAGSGARLGASRPKAFVGLAGQVMLAHSLQAFEAHEAVDSIVLVVPDGWVGPTEMLVDDLGCDRVTSIEVGGASRAASVRAGLDAVPDRRGTAVLVHDAARPLVSSAVIDRVLAPLADGFDAVVPTLRVADTVKRVNPGAGVVVETLEREELRLAQTPQACRSSILHAALRDLDDAALAAVTDDAAAVERAGGRVLCVEGDPAAAKVTTRHDLEVLEQRLAPPPDVLSDVEDEPDDPEDLEPLDEHDLAGFEERRAAPGAET